MQNLTIFQLNNNAFQFDMYDSANMCTMATKGNTVLALLGNINKGHYDIPVLR